MKDYEYLIHLLYCYVNNSAPIEKPREVSFKNVYNLAKLHEVADIAYTSVEKLKNKPNEELLNEWKLSYYFAAQRDIRQTMDRENVLGVLHSNNIRTLEAQGTVTKKLYPEPFLRLMTDIDIVVDFDNIKKTRAVLENMGYAVTQHQELEFFAVKENATELDIHSDFFTEYMYNRQERYHSAISAPFEHAYSDDGMTYFLTDDYFYLYSVLHIIKHFETAGCGIRRILDLYYLKSAFENKINLEFFNEVIDKNDFRNSYDTLIALEGVWFENRETDINLDEAISDVISSGNHGNEDVFTRNNVRKDVESGMHFARIKRVISFVFPEKEYVYIGYPVCKERGYSTVMCWLYRFFATIKKFSFSHALSHIKQILKSK